MLCVNNLLLWRLFGVVKRRSTGLKFEQLHSLVWFAAAYCVASATKAQLARFGELPEEIVPFHELLDPPLDSNGCLKLLRTTHDLRLFVVRQRKIHGVVIRGCVSCVCRRSPRTTFVPLPFPKPMCMRACVFIAGAFQCQELFRVAGH